MEKTKRISFFGALLLAFVTIPSVAQSFTVTSPDSRNAAKVEVTKNASGNTEITYSFRHCGQDVILPSSLDLTVDNHTWEMATGKRSVPKLDKWFDNLILSGTETYARDTTWHNAFGECSMVRDACNGLILHFVKNDSSECSLDIEFRAYDEGIAFRYILPMHPTALYHRIKAENTEFRLPGGTYAWHAAWAQSGYNRLPLENWPEDAERPLTLELPGGLYAAVGEAAVVDFPRGKLRLSATKPNTIVTSLNDDATDLVTPYNFPWRYVMAAGRLGALLENNYMVLNLNEASKIADESWIRPGKIIRETRLTDANSKACIDFAAKHNMQYILYDWKWYGPSFDFASDATEVVVPFNMEEIVEYGKARGVGIWVYVNQHALQKQGRHLFETYRKWGLAGVKFGFVHFTSQHWADWVHGLVRDAADNRIMVNIHDEYRPTGYSRTYPNLLTQEGICGNEEFPSATHNTILPFTRMLCGAADYTVCYFDPRLKTTHAHQLALPVMYFSPLQTLYWYDTPARIKETPELAFFDAVPTVWDETRVVNDDIARSAAVVRRSGDSWFLGAIACDEGAGLTFGASFLKDGTKYLMTLYSDDPAVDTPTKVAVRKFIVSSTSILNFRLLPKGGAAAIFTPATPADLRVTKALKKNTVL